MRVAIIGGTGFVGGYLIDQFLDAGHTVSVLVRAGSENKIQQSDAVEIVSGDLQSQDAIDTVCRGSDAVVYAVGILREFPAKGITFEETQYLGVQRTLAAAENAGVTKFLLMSANGVQARGTPYQDTKFRAEELLRNGGLDYTIFRPSIIFGDPSGKMEFATQLHQDMVAPPVPAIDFFTGWHPAAGSVPMSPVHVRDVAKAFEAALRDASLSRKTLHLGGPEILTWHEMLQRIAQAVGKKKLIVPMPVAVMKLAATFLDWIPQFPVTRDQLTMLAEGNVAAADELSNIIGDTLLAFDCQQLSYLKKYTE